jgi:hypothetical protein
VSLYYPHTLIIRNYMFTLVCVLLKTRVNWFGQILGLSYMSKDSEIHTCRFYLLIFIAFVRFFWLQVTTAHFNYFRKIGVFHKVVYELEEWMILRSSLYFSLFFLFFSPSFCPHIYTALSSTYRCTSLEFCLYMTSLLAASLCIINNLKSSAPTVVWTLALFSYSLLSESDWFSLSLS